MRRLMSLAVLAVIALGALAASPKQSNTLELLNTPVYGGEATFHVQLYKKAQLVNSVVWCYQSGAYVWMQEEFLPNSGWSKGQWEGDIIFGPLEGNGDLEGPGLNQTIPANCVGVVFQEAQSASQGRTVLTNSVQFEVMP